MDIPAIKRKSNSKKQTINSSQTEVVNELQKRYFEDDNNFIDYFLEIGVKPEIFKNRILYESDDPEDINQHLVPQIITKFPNFDKKHIVIESSMIHQIFPQGFSIIESTIKPSPTFYCLILDNQLYSAIYTRKYLACLIIYESIEQYKKLYDIFQSSNNDKFLAILKNMTNNRKETKFSEKYKNFYIPKCLCLVSVHPYIDKFEEILRTISDIVSSNTFPNIFVDHIIEKLIIETPKIPRGLKKIFVKFPNNEIELTESKMNELPSVNVNLAYTFEIMSSNNLIEIYRYLLFETKLIFFSEDLYKLTNTILTFVFLLSPFNYQFQIVSILSKDLYNFIETISPFIFGINEKYDENFFTKNKISIEVTTICIVDIDKDSYCMIAPGGNLDSKEFPDYPKKLRKKLEDKIKNYLINKKKRKSQNNSNISLFLSKPCNTLKNLFEENIIQRSTTCKIKYICTEVNDKLSNTCLNYINEKHEEKFLGENKEIQIIFSKFMINLLKDYPKFLTKDYSVNRDISMSIKDMIDLKSYLNLYGSGERDFYQKIFSTQMFMEFIYKRMMPKDCNEKVEILYIEEKINEKIQKKKKLFNKLGKSKNLSQNLLLHCKDYDYDEKEVIIDLTFKEGITSSLKYYFFNNKLLLSEFLCKGYDIKVNNDTKEVSFTYHVFPSLLSDRIFILNIEEYQKGNTLFFKDIEEINTKIVNKSAMKFIQENSELKNSENENDLYLCYIILWSIGFWYTEDDERNYRFLMMLEILEKVEEHDVKIFEVLFRTLVEYSKDENVILLYKKFIHLRLNPTWDMFSLVSKVIKKKQNASQKNKLLHQETQLDKLKLKEEYENHKKDGDLLNSRRTFKVMGRDDFVFTTEVLFYAYFVCKKCNGIINLGEICSNLKLLKMEKDSNGFERLKCNNKNKEGKICDNLCDQKFKFKFGEELYNQKIGINQIFRFYTSFSNSISLLSPNEIKNKLLQIAALNSKKKEKFDVENFRYDYPDIFWSLVWYFDLNNIDKSFMLPYDYILKNKDSNSDDSKKINYIYDKFNPKQKSNDPKKDNNNNNNKNIKRKSILIKTVNRINVKNTNNKFNMFKKRKKERRYKTEDLCVQKLFDLAIIENIGLLTYKSLLIYQKNVAYNELPLLPYDKDNSTSRGSLLYFNDSESSTGTSLVRDSLLSHQAFKGSNTLGPAKVSKLSKSGPGLSNMGLKLSGRDSVVSKCIVFEDSDDSLDDK